MATATEKPSANGAGKTETLSREQFLERAKAAVKEELVDVPELGGKVKVRGFTKGQEQGIRHASMKGGKLDTDLYEMLVLLGGVVEPQFTEADIAELKDAYAGTLNRILERILDLSGLTEGAQDRAAELFR